MDVLKGLTLKAAGLRPRTDFVSVPAGASLEEIAALLPGTTQTVFPVKDGEGRYCGLFDLSDVRKFLYRNRDLAGHVIIAQDLLTDSVDPVRPDTDLSVVMARFAKLKYDELPVIDPATLEVTGMLGRREIIALYEELLVKRG
jgi:CBS domain-containing protein